MTILNTDRLALVQDANPNEIYNRIQTTPAIMSISPERPLDEAAFLMEQQINVLRPSSITRIELFRFTGLGHVRHKGVALYSVEKTQPLLLIPHAHLGLNDRGTRLTRKLFYKINLASETFDDVNRMTLYNPLEYGIIIWCKPTR